MRTLKETLELQELVRTYKTAMFYLRQDMPAEAIVGFRRAKRIAERNMASAPGACIAVFIGLAAAYFRQGDRIAAHAIYQWGIRLALSRLGAEAPETKQMIGAYLKGGSKGDIGFTFKHMYN